MAPLAVVIVVLPARLKLGTGAPNISRLMRKLGILKLAHNFFFVTY